MSTEAGAIREAIDQAVYDTAQVRIQSHTKYKIADGPIGGQLSWVIRSHINS